LPQRQDRQAGPDSDAGVEFGVGRGGLGDLEVEVRVEIGLEELERAGQTTQLE